MRDKGTKILSIILTHTHTHSQYFSKDFLCKSF